MITNILLAGTGGQGVLSSAAVITFSALHDNFFVSQSEVHGMAQRGGSVNAQVRISNSPIMSTLIPQGTIDLIISMEPLEGLRHASSLNPDGHMITATECVNTFAGYPDATEVVAAVHNLPHCTCFDLEKELHTRSLALHTKNMFLVGVASSLISAVSEKAYAIGIQKVFSQKGTSVVAGNNTAFYKGRRVGALQLR